MQFRARPRRKLPTNLTLESLEDRFAPATVSIRDVQVVESSRGGARFTVALSAPSQVAVSVNFTTVDGSATVKGHDYHAVHGRLTFLPGQSTDHIIVPVLGDSKPEADETFKVVLSQPSNARLGRSTAIGHILNDDTRITIRAANALDASSSSDALFAVQLSAPTPAPISVHFATEDGSAVAAHGDYTSVSGSVRFRAGQRTALIHVPVAASNDVAEKSFFVVLSAPVGGLLGTARATGIIPGGNAPPTTGGGSSNSTTAPPDNSPPPPPLPTLTIGNVTHAEGNSGTTAFSFPVTLSGPSASPVSVNFTTADGSATLAGNDYQQASGTLTIPANATTATITVLVKGDTSVEQDETFQVRLSSPVGATIASGRDIATASITNDDQLPATGPQILLDNTTLTRLRQAAAQNTPQWQAFKARLDSNLSVHIAADIGMYQGDELPFISDYALGYQVLKDSAPLTAANYADKALSLMKSGVNDFQKGGWVSRQFLARGDGNTRTFTLPNADLDPSTLSVYLSDVTTEAVHRGSANTADSVDGLSIFLKASNSADGPADYLEGTDWRHNPDLPNDELDWSLPGKEPAKGSTYFVTLTSPASNIDRTNNFTLNGHTITFTQAPGAGKAVFVEYIYGTHSADGSTLAFQETGSGDGGFNSILIDTSYTSRYLGKHLAMGLDWLDGYAGFSAALKSKVENMLVRWSDYVRDNGYYADSPASNYGAGGYDSRVMTALALDHRTAEGPRLMSEVLAYRQANVLPLLQNPTTSLKGGFWAEGWNYGQLATENLLTAALALESAGQASAAPERLWADEVIEHLVTAQAGDSVYDNGDWYTYPTPFPGGLDTLKDLWTMLGTTASTASHRAYANYVLQNFGGSITPNFADLLFRDRSATASFWSDLPLAHFASGTGLVSARSDWTSGATVVAAQIGNLLDADHQGHNPGQLEFWRGSDPLLINAASVTELQDPSARSAFSNIVVVDAHGDLNADGTPVQTYPFNTGSWYGTPGVTIKNYEADARHVYVDGDYHAAYSAASHDGEGGPTSELTRQMVYVRPGYVFVYDRVTTLNPDYAKQLRWHFLNTPTVSGNTFVASAGQSKLFGATFSSVPLTTSAASVTPNPDAPALKVGEIITQNTSATASVRYVTAFQIASSTTTAMDATQRVVSSDGRMEGSRIGNQLVLFGRNGAVDLTTPLTYTLTGNASVDHLLTDLQPGKAYQLRIDGAAATPVVASSQGTLSFTTPAAAHSIQVSL